MSENKLQDCRAGQGKADRGNTENRVIMWSGLSASETALVGVGLTHVIQCGPTPMMSTSRFRVTLRHTNDRTQRRRTGTR
jgi:hypothetical protein